MTTLKEATVNPAAPPRLDMRVLKRLVRNVLPARMHGALRRAVHTRQLNRAPVMVADVSRLPRAAEISFPEMLRSDGREDGWEKAKSSIREVFDYVPGSHAVDPESGRAIYHLIRRLEPRSVLEIGTNCGASTVHAAMAMREYRNTGRPPRLVTPRLVTVDLFDVNDPASTEAKRYRISAPPRELLAGLDCADLVEFAVARSTDYLNEREAEFDFILLDHCPAADIAYRDIVLAIRALRPGGQLLLHSFFSGRKPLGTGERVNSDSFLAVRRLRREGAPLVALPLGALPWPTKSGASNLTSLALLARQ